MALLDSENEWGFTLCVSESIFYTMWRTPRKVVFIGVAFQSPVRILQTFQSGFIAENVSLSLFIYFFE